MSELRQFARPMMRPAACLHRDEASWLSGKEVEQLSAGQFATKHSLAAFIGPMRVKRTLGDIQPDCDNLRHGRPPQVVINTSTLAHRCRRGASTPSALHAKVLRFDSLAHNAVSKDRVWDKPVIGAHTRARRV